MSTTRRFLLIALLGASVFCQAQDKYEVPTLQHGWIGIDAGVYLPSGTIHDVYGSGIKLGIGPVTRVRSERWQIVPDVSIIAQRSNGNKLLIVPVEAALQRSFGSYKAANRTYARFCLGLNYNDHSFNWNSNYYSNKTVGAAAAAEYGFIVARRWMVTARYDLLAKSDGFDFSGFTFAVQYSAFRY